MSRPREFYYTIYPSEYSDSNEIVVNMYYANVRLPGGGTDPLNTQVSDRKYILILRLNNDKTQLTFETTYNNSIITGFININNQGRVDSYFSGTLKFNLVGNNMIQGWTDDLEFQLFFIMDDFRKFSTFRQAGVQFVLQQEETENTTMNNVNKFLKQAINDTEVQIYYQTDNLGVNLGEMLAILISDHSYPNGFPKKLIGYCDNIPTTNTTGIDTFYSFKPKLNKVLKLEGDNLLDQTNKINKKYNSITIDNYEKNCIFFKNILAYSTLRYMFGGLSNNSVFSCKWLYSNNYNKFLRNLENSEFAAIVPIFTQPQPRFDFSNYNQYFRSCVQHQ